MKSNLFMNTSVHKGAKAMNRLSVHCQFCGGCAIQSSDDVLELKCPDCKVTIVLSEEVYWKLRLNRSIKERSKAGIIMSLGRLHTLYDSKGLRPHLRALKAIAEVILDEPNDLQK